MLLSRNIVKSVFKNAEFVLPRVQYFHSTAPKFGIEEFYDQNVKDNETLITGREWTVPDLRRKSYDDLHKLWYVLYKERNLLLTMREAIRRAQRPITSAEESRYIKVKRSMAGIKIVIKERKKIEMKIDPPPEGYNKTPGRRTRIFPLSE
mmetsp:Transcript_6183/g.9323  ORF Transcript_6183/g.9323 Transcript_6183/m.9323 type:complete len:150 (-) Transcript_6183:133-582(-)